MSNTDSIYIRTLVDKYNLQKPYPPRNASEFVEYIKSLEGDWCLEACLVPRQNYLDNTSKKCDECGSSTEHFPFCESK